MSDTSLSFDQICDTIYSRDPGDPTIQELQRRGLLPADATTATTEELDWCADLLAFERLLDPQGVDFLAGLPDRVRKQDFAELRRYVSGDKASRPEETLLRAQQIIERLPWILARTVRSARFIARTDPDTRRQAGIERMVNQLRVVASGLLPMVSALADEIPDGAEATGIGRQG